MHKKRHCELKENPQFYIGWCGYKTFSNCQSLNTSDAEWSCTDVKWWMLKLVEKHGKDVFSLVQQIKFVEIESWLQCWCEVFVVDLFGAFYDVASFALWDATDMHMLLLCWNPSSSKLEHHWMEHTLTRVLENAMGKMGQTTHDKMIALFDKLTCDCVWLKLNPCGLLCHEDMRHTLCWWIKKTWSSWRKCRLRRQCLGGLTLPEVWRSHLIWAKVFNTRDQMAMEIQTKQQPASTISVQEWPLTLMHLHWKHVDLTQHFLNAWSAQDCLGRACAPPPLWWFIIVQMEGSPNMSRNSAHQQVSQQQVASRSSLQLHVCHPCWFFVQPMQ